MIAHLQAVSHVGCFLYCASELTSVFSDFVLLSSSWFTLSLESLKISVPYESFKIEAVSHAGCLLYCASSPAYSVILFCCLLRGLL